MKAFFDKNDHPKVKILVKGKRQKGALNCLLDSGFDGYLCLPISVAVGLGLELVSIQQVQYADGRLSQELVFKITVNLGGRDKEIEATLTSANEALVGTALLANNIVTFNFPKKKISIKNS